MHGNRKVKPRTKFIETIKTHSLYSVLNSVCQHSHFITQCNYKATCFDYGFVILRPILSVVSQDTMPTLGSQSGQSIW